MKHNLIPPFILREAGVQVRDTPKIHVDDPTVSDHAITLPDANLSIPLKLNGIFSFFHTRMPTIAEVETLDPILITPDSEAWNPYSTHFAENEDSMVDYEGNITTGRHRTVHVLNYNPELDTPSDYDGILDSVAATSFTLPAKGQVFSTEVERFSNALNARTEISKMTGSIGATCARNDENDDLFEIDMSNNSDENLPTQLPTNNPNEMQGNLSSMTSHFQSELNTRFLNSELSDATFTHLDNFKAEIDAAQASNPTGVSPEFLSKIWRIRKDQASRAIDQTTHRCRHGADNQLSRQYATNDRMLRYKRIDSQFYTDTFFVTKKAESTRGNKCAQLFVSDMGFVAIYPMNRKSQYIDALKLFCKEVGVPETLVVDPSGEQTSKEAKNYCHKVGTTLRILEESTQWANRAELYIGLFKESIRQDLSRTHCPLVLWDFCAERRAKIHNIIPRDLFQLNGSNPTTATFGTQGDISNICTFDWYDWCYYREEGGTKFPFQKRLLGRVLGPMKNQGNEMTQAVLNIKGQIIPRRTCAPLTTDEIHSPSEQAKRRKFDEEIARILGDSITLPPKPPPIETDDLHLEPDEVTEPSPLDSDPDPISEDGTAVFDLPITDALIHAEVSLPQGEKMLSGKVIGRATDHDGSTIGEYDANPLMNTMLYDVEFDDGVLKQYSANIIAENMYSQVDDQGYSTTLLDGIIDYKKDDTAVTKEDMYITTKSGQRRMRQTTQGWKLLIKFKDDSEQWVPLKLLKETNPVDVAEFAEAKGISEEPAFAYWVPYTLRRRDRIISAVNSRVRKQNVKYGIKVPTTIDEAKRFDRENGDTFWCDAINKEMANVRVAFEILEKGKPIPVGWSKSSGHLVFDVKMDFTRKARWVKDGHRTPEPDQSTYAGVVSRESVRIALTYAALNGLNVAAADIKNAYLQAPSSEKHYVICGAEFGLENIGKVALIRRALYGGKSSGADFWKHLRSCMAHIGFNSCKADPDIWMRPAMKDDGTAYYEYVLLYVDDALCCSMNPEHVLKNEIGRYFYIKEGSVGPPSIYLGNKVSKVTLDNDVEAWSLSSSQYVQNAVENVEKQLKKDGKCLPKRANSPLSSNYRPELDISPELDPARASLYQSYIGILRWITELGRIDITCEISMMASCMAMPREGHLDQVYHIFAYLKNKHNTELVLDPSEPDINLNLFQEEDWTHSQYGSEKEDLPPNMPKPLGQGVKLVAYVDSDHAGDSITRRSRTGFIVYMNSSPIYWTSKKQTSIETSSFGSEFIAMKTCCEYLRGLRYKLRMMGIPCEFPSYIFGDNQSVLANTTKPFSMLKKKSCSIAYHFVREGVSKGEWITTYVNTHDNVADILTKPLPGGEKRTKFVRMLLHHIT